MTGPAIPRLLCTGSMEYTDRLTLWNGLARIRKAWEGRMILDHGDAPAGFDRLAEAWVRRTRSSWVTSDPLPADWAGPKGLGAGPDRNQQLVNRLPRLALIGLHPGARNAGTLDCAERILAAGLTWEAWWGRVGNTPARLVDETELRELIAAAKLARAQRRKPKPSSSSWMEALDV